MAVTLGQQKSIFYALIREDNPANVTNPNTHFTDATVVAGFLNQGMEFAAVFIEYPRDITSVLAVQGIGSYPNPSDNLMIRTAYFGNRDTLTGDIRPIKVVSEETLKTIYPSWMDQTVSTQSDFPEYLIQLDRKTVYIYPRPNANAVAQSRKLFLNYNYVPASMVNDSDVPDLPAPYHNLLPFYAAHLAYIALQQPALSAQMYEQFMDKIQKLKSAVTKETKEGLGLSWGYDGMDVDVNQGPNVTFP